MTYRLFIVEDDGGIAQAVQKQAASWGLEVAVCQRFDRVMGEFAAFSPHIVLLDISLPFFDGYHWCSELRRVSKVPVIFISSACDNMNIVMAMSMGADDFIAKPFDARVLMAKLQALLRRAYDYTLPAASLSCRGAVLNTDDQSLSFGGQKLALTKNEYRILLCLMENAGRIVSREKLTEQLWETDQYIDDNTLTVNVNRLRRKLETAGLNDFIVTKFGVGYLVEGGA